MIAERHQDLRLTDLEVLVWLSKVTNTSRHNNTASHGINRTSVVEEAGGLVEVVVAVLYEVR